MQLPAQNQVASRSVQVRKDRVGALDGLRGLLTLMVLFGHDLGEAPHGIRGFAVAWVAVAAFFVLSGFLITRQVLDGGHRPGFLITFTIRRLFRTVPAYVVTVLVAFAVYSTLADQLWLDVPSALPLWSYLTFTQDLAMVAADSPGARWLAPTWTLAVQEQFYVLAPLLVLVLPRRFLLPCLGAMVCGAVAFRAAIVVVPGMPPLAGLVLLPGVGDSLVLGMIAAVLVSTPGIAWARCALAIRLAAPVLLTAAIALRLVDGAHGHLFDIFGPLAVSLAAAAFVLSLVQGAPEASRLQSPKLRFCGRISYGLYLSHLMVLGLLHGLFRNSVPDMGTLAGIALTLIALPVSLLMAYAMTRLIEEPMIDFGKALVQGRTTGHGRLVAGGLAPA
jgi:peptidoglycan/LPS O-acetylase OafA/YrhL